MNDKEGAMSDKQTAMSEEQTERVHRGPWLMLLGLAIIIAGAAAAVYFLGYLPRKQTTKQLDAAAAVRRVTPPLVNAAVVKRAATNSQLELPGNITPITEAYIYARAAGYLKRRYVDIGDHVKAGQKLADIEAPDLDQQVSQARAALAQAQGQLGQAQATLEQLTATRDLAEVTWQRYKILTAAGAVSRQDGDNQSTAATTSAANVVAQQKTVRATEEFINASQATLDRLLTLQGYEQITAPFDGFITARNVDVGALISANGSSLGPVRSNTAGPSDVPSEGEMFRLAEIGNLRILVSVPQTNAPGVRVGQRATVTVQQIPNLSFPGKVTRTSESLDAQSRTLLTEVDVDNPKGVLLPGMYVMVSFITDRIDPPFMVPDAALVVRSSGTVLALLQPLTPEEQKARASEIDQATLSRVRRVHFQAVEPGRDYGVELEIPKGLKVGQEVVIDPGDAVQEGALVQIAVPGSPQQGAQ
jgi:multidrug efflux pump subunit AcrA (membrane-fusion protein)